MIEFISKVLPGGAAFFLSAVFLVVFVVKMVRWSVKTLMNVK